MRFPFNGEHTNGWGQLPHNGTQPQDGQAYEGRQAKWIRRSRKIAREAESAAERWRQDNDVIFAAEPITGDFYQPLPRDPKLVASKDRPFTLPAPRRDVAFHAGLFRTVGRLLVWMAGLTPFAAQWLREGLRARLKGEARDHELLAQMLREAFQELGPTFVKIGQQLSMRLDLFPFTYTRELEKLLDDVPPFPTEDAICTIEKCAGRSIQEMFSAFDPNPIGSASVACVYQAVLPSGERVAVKVRRPGIGPRLAADMRALGWLLSAIEVIFLAPGFTKNFAFEISSMLMEELDFVREGRFTDLFRIATRRCHGMGFVTSPRVYFDLSNDEVLVTEFVSGVCLADILIAFETDDKDAIRKLEEMNFDRVKMADRIQVIARFNNFENTFFHADLHPGNILIQDHNQVVLIDFGSCGSFDYKELNSWRRWFDAQSIDDVGGMVQAAMGILEPLPPVDKSAFGLRMETMFWRDLHAIKSKHSEWTERISSRMWIGFLNLCREFMIPMRLNTLRMIRASMLTDTIAARLDHDQDPYRQFRRYEKAAGRRAKKKVFKRLHRLAGPSKFIRLQYGIESGIKLFYNLQRMIESFRWIDFGVIIAKIDYFLTMMLKHLAWTLSTLILFSSYRYFVGPYGWEPAKIPPEAKSIGGAVLYVAGNSVGWWILTVLPIPLILWRIYFRLRQPRKWDS